MEELVSRWGETVHLAVLDDVQAVYIEKLQPTTNKQVGTAELRNRPERFDG